MKWLDSESSKACDRGYFRCENDPCIREELRCNGINDCPYDMSDELDCPYNSNGTNHNNRKSILMQK